MSRVDENGPFDPAEVPSLVEDLRAGDDVAAAVVRRRVRKILAFRGFGIDREDRLDLEQIVMTQLWQAVSRPEFDTSGFWGFVEVVVARRCVDWLRSRRPVTDLDEQQHILVSRDDPLRDALVSERHELARAALERLPRSCRELIELHNAKGKSYAEMAEILDRSEGALRVQMHRCISRAAGELKKLLGERNVKKNQKRM